MRIRRKPWARPELAACPFCIDHPEAYRNHWQTAFPAVQPLYIELGCGKGTFAAQKAFDTPNVNFLAVDIKSDILGLTKRRIEQTYQEAGSSVDNIRIFAYDIERILQAVGPGDRVERIYINFCNPWPKKKHKKRRLTYPVQLKSYQEFLKEEGEIWFKTDDEELFAESLEYFAECGFEPTYLTYDLVAAQRPDNIITEHEQMFMDQGIKIKFVIMANRRRKEEQE